MKREFIETEVFYKKWYQLGFTDVELTKLEEHLAENPKAGDVIPGTGGIRKIRFSFGNKGKRGGVRVIYIDILVHERIYMLDVYPENLKNDLTDNEKKELKKLSQIIKSGE